MIKSVTVVNHLGESLKLDLASPEKSGFIVKSIDALQIISEDDYNMLLDLSNN